jgi:hypothetical protein
MAVHISPQVDQFDEGERHTSQIGLFAIVPMWITHYDFDVAELGTWVCVRALGGELPVVTTPDAIAAILGVDAATVERATRRLQSLDLLTVDQTDDGAVYSTPDIDPRKAIG